MSYLRSFAPAWQLQRLNSTKLEMPRPARLAHLVMSASTRRRSEQASVAHVHREARIPPTSITQALADSAGTGGQPYGALSRRCRRWVARLRTLRRRASKIVAPLRWGWRPADERVPANPRHIYRIHATACILTTAPCRLAPQVQLVQSARTWARAVTGVRAQLPPRVDSAESRGQRQSESESGKRSHGVCVSWL